jgi:hypothetical protein
LSKLKPQAMKIEIKNIKINTAFSEETVCFKADVYVNGVKTAYASNDGHGGCTFYNAYENKRELLRQAEAYAQSLPSTTETFGETTITLESNLERMIDDVVYKASNDKENAKFEKKILKATETAIVYGVPNSGSFQSIAFKGKPKLADVMLTLQGRDAITRLVNRIKGELKDGEVILNTNIPF